MNADVDAYVARSQRWPAELAAARSLLLACDLDEAIKWGKPCFGLGGTNVAILQEMKDFLALMFFKGALLDDPDGVLEEQGPNSRSAKRVCFRSVDDVTRLSDAVTGLVARAIAAEDAGLEPPPRPELVLVDELQRRLDGDPALRTAFESLTPGRRREYHLHVSEAKQASTRESRIDRCTDRILAGKGLRDR